MFNDLMFNVLQLIGRQVLAFSSNKIDFKNLSVKLSFVIE